MIDGNGNVILLLFDYYYSSKLEFLKVIFREDENSFWIMFRIYVVYIKYKYFIC